MPSAGAACIIGNIMQRFSCRVFRYLFFLLHICIFLLLLAILCTDLRTSNKYIWIGGFCIIPIKNTKIRCVILSIFKYWHFCNFWQFRHTLPILTILTIFLTIFSFDNFDNFYNIDRYTNVANIANVDNVDNIANALLVKRGNG